MGKSTNSCAVYRCGGRTRPMFRFPHPKKNLELFFVWVELVQNPRLGGLSPLQIYNRGYVCHRHFKATDLFARKNLIENAVPTLNLPPKKTRVVPKLGVQEIDLPEITRNTSDIPAIDVSIDDSDRQLVDEFDLIRNLSLFDAKLFNIDDFKLPLFIPTELSEKNNDSHQTISQNELRTELTTTLVEFQQIVEDKNLDEIVELLSTDSTEVNPDFTEKPYFKSIKCFLPDTDKFAEVCRICFHSLIAEEDVIKLYSEDIFIVDKTRLKKLLKLVLPDIDLEIYTNVVICKKCVQLLESSYQLKELWLSTETMLQQILENKEVIINREADLILTEEKNETSFVANHNYTVTSTNLKQQSDEEQTLADSLLGNSSSRSDNFSKTEKVCYGELNTNNLTQAKPGRSRKKIKRKSQTKPVSSQKKIIRKSYGLGPYVCEQCGCVFTVSRKFRRHLLWHEIQKKPKKPKKPRERKIMCEICGGLFLTSFVLKQHSQTHAEPKCSFCGKEFKNIKGLQSHIREVHRRTSSQCHLCGKKLISRSSLSTHLKRHNPRKRRHACNICDKKFLYPVLLRNHLRSHFSERSLTCDYCGKSMKYEHSLQRHVKTFHMNEGEFVCEFCNKPYWKKVDLQRHTIRVHGCVSENQKEVVLANETNYCTDAPVNEVEYEV